MCAFWFVYKMCFIGLCASHTRDSHSNWIPSIWNLTLRAGYTFCAFHSLDFPSTNVWDMRIVMVFVCVYICIYLYKRDACGFHSFRSSRIFYHSHFFTLYRETFRPPSLFSRHITNWIFQFDTLYMLWIVCVCVCYTMGKIGIIISKVFFFCDARRGDVLL